MFGNLLHSSYFPRRLIWNENRFDILWALGKMVTSWSYFYANKTCYCKDVPQFDIYCIYTVLVLHSSYNNSNNMVLTNSSYMVLQLYYILYILIIYYTWGVLSIYCLCLLLKENIKNKLRLRKINLEVECIERSKKYFFDMFNA